MPEYSDWQSWPKGFNACHIKAEAMLWTTKSINCKCPVMQKQQFGRSANAATPGSLDEELEAAYRQFGRALGETPRETSKVASCLPS